MGGVPRLLLCTHRTARFDCAHLSPQSPVCHHLCPRFRSCHRDVSPHRQFGDVRSRLGLLTALPCKLVLVDLCRIVLGGCGDIHATAGSTRHHAESESVNTRTATCASTPKATCRSCGICQYWPDFAECPRSLELLPCITLINPPTLSLQAVYQ